MYCYSEQHINICSEVFRINAWTCQTGSNGTSAMKVGGLVVLGEMWRNKAFLIWYYPLISRLMAEILWMEHNLFLKTVTDHLFIFTAIVLLNHYLTLVIFYIDCPQHILTGKTDMQNLLWQAWQRTILGLKGVFAL